MKGIGKKIFTAVVALLLLAVPFAVAWGVTNGMNNGTKVMTLAEARELADKVCRACTSEYSNQLSPASDIGYYEYDHVRMLEAGGTSYLQYMFIVKYALEDGKDSEDFLKSSYDFFAGVTIFLGYKLVDNGIIANMNTESEYGNQFSHIEMRYLDDSKKEWMLMVTNTEDVLHEIENLSSNPQHWANINIVIGESENLSMKRYQQYYIECDSSIYEDPFTRESINTLDCVDVDSTLHRIQKLSLTHENETDIHYKDQEGNLVPIGGFTDEMFASLTSTIRDYISDFWSPKLYEKQFKDSNCLENMYIYVAPISAQFQADYDQYYRS